MTSWKYIVIIALFLLSACERETEGYTEISVDAPKVKISASVNTNGEIQLSGAYVIKRFDVAGLGGVSWEVGVTETLKLAKSKTNTLFILYEENEEITRQIYDIGQPFEITFADDQWVRKIESDGRGNTMVFVEKRVASPSIAEPEMNPDLQSNEYWCDDQDGVKLSVGEKARVVWPKVNLRSYPEVPQDFYANIVAEVAEGIWVTVIGGPECAHEGTWWEIRTEYGDTGWMREFISDGYLLK